MGLNCQLCAGNPCFCGDPRTEADPVLRPTSHLHASPTTRLFLLALLTLTACGDSGGGDNGSDSDSEQATSATTTAATTTAATGGSAATDEGGSDSPADTGVETGDPGVVGPNLGLLTFTSYAADAAGSPEQLGMAGAWRTEPFTTDDFYGVHALGLFFPLAPAAADTLELHEPDFYDWGKGSTWVALGNGLRLQRDGADALACLQVVADLYPVYFSDDAPLFDPACAPDPKQWSPGATYDLLAYGGDAYDDQARGAAVRTPTALTVTAPAIDVFDFPLSSADDLPLAWTADGADGDRVVIRVWDQFGRQLVVHAADDGSYTLAADDLAKLALGPLTLTLAREHLSEVPLAAGTLRVVARHEITAYPDLF